MKLRNLFLLMAMSLGLVACAPASPIAATSPTAALLPMPSRTPTPAVRPQLPTPAPPPTYTPTPTPTPVTYVVKKGDTLGGIAYAYGISVDGLQAANPSVLPAFLSIGTVLTIPVLAESAVSVGPAAVASPTPMPATVAVGPDCYHLTTGALYCLAEVRNPGPAPLYNVAAQIALIGPEGEVLASEVAFAALAMVRPGSGVPLAALFQGAPPGLAAPVAQVVSAEPVPAGVVAAVALDISAAQLVPPQVASPGALWTVSGQVHNGSAAAVGAVRLVVALYDAQKHLVGYRQVQIPGGLAAGVSQGFSISAASLGGPVESYAIAAEGKP